MKTSAQCLCKGVSFEADLGDAPEFGVCHCKMCQRWSGGPGFALEADSVTFRSDQTLTWYASSDWAERGFCGTCGTSLFYRLKADPGQYFIFVGCLDLPDSTTLTEHIFVDEKPAYYDFADDAPRLTGAQFLERIQGTSP